MTTQEELTNFTNMRQEALDSLNRWMSQSAITPEINEEISKLTQGAVIGTAQITGQISNELVNLFKCIVTAAWQYGRRFPIKEFNWTVAEDKNETPI